MDMMKVDSGRQIRHSDEVRAGLLSTRLQSRLPADSVCTKLVLMLNVPPPSWPFIPPLTG